MEVKPSLEFGLFRLDPAEHRLLRSGQPVALAPKVFDLLVVLVENRGRLVGKDDLMRRLWPDTFVEEANLAYNVSALRKALGDSDGERRYIETVPKHGYRFTADVRAVAEKPLAVAAAPSSRRVRAGGVALWIGTAVVALALSGAVWWGATRFRDADRPPSTATELRVVPLTSYPGYENFAAFSPDGNRVAFVWDGPRQDNLDIYVKTIGSDPPLPLTSDPASDTEPVWCLNGRQIAFLRQGAGRGAVYLVSPTGGAERRLAEVSVAGQGYGRHRLAASPDGKVLAVSVTEGGQGPRHIELLSVDTGAILRRLTSPPSGANGDWNPSFARDGSSLVFSRSLGARMEDLYLVPIDGGEPRRLTWDTTPISGTAWSADGQDIVYVSERKLWRLPVAAGVRTRIRVGEDLGAASALSVTTGRLAITRGVTDTNIWRLALGPDGRARGATRLIASTFADAAAEYSPDSARIAFYSSRSGEGEIWVCDSEGRNPLRLTSSGNATLPHWAPDGKSIVFEAKTEGSMDLWIVGAEGGNPRRLTSEPTEEIVPRWSRDGAFIYFGSNRSGSLQIWKMPPGGGEPIQVTRGGGVEARESADGRFVYYYKTRTTPGLWRVSVEGGAEQLVLDHPEVGPSRMWEVVKQGIYLVVPANRQRPMLQLFSFATRELSLVAELARPIAGLSASRDGKALLLAQIDQSGSDLMLVENFR